MRKLLLASFLALAAPACAPESGAPGAMMPSDPTDPSNPGDIDGPSAGTMVTPTLDPSVPATTDYDKVALTGRAPGAISVVVNSPRGDYAAPVGSEGDFCVVVPLNAGAANMLTVRGENAAGKKSDPVEFKVTQSGTHPGTPLPPENVEAGADVVVDQLDMLGDAAYLLDKNPNTVVTVDSWVTGNGNYLIRLNMPAIERIKTVKVTSPSGCFFQSFRMFYARTATSASSPYDASSSTWNEIPITVSGSGLDSFTFQNAVEMGALALLPTEDTSPCHGSFGHDIFKISDIEAITESTVVPPEGPKCQ